MPESRAAKRPVDVIEISDDEDDAPIRHSGRRMRQLSVENGSLPVQNGSISVESGSLPGHLHHKHNRTPVVLRWDRGSSPMPEFLGDFATVAEAEASTGLWRVGMSGW